MGRSSEALPLTSHIDGLPYELLQKVFSFLECSPDRVQFRSDRHVYVLPQALVLTQVSTKFRRVMHQSAFWQDKDLNFDEYLDHGGRWDITQETYLHLGTTLPPNIFGGYID